MGVFLLEYRHIDPFFSDRKYIDTNDIEKHNITSSLTKSQANAVRRRIQNLNESIQQNQSNSKKSEYIIPPSQQSGRKHVKNVFDKSRSHKDRSNRTLTGDRPDRTVRDQR